MLLAWARPKKKCVQMCGCLTKLTRESYSRLRDVSGALRACVRFKDGSIGTHHYDGHLDFWSNVTGHTHFQN